MKKIIYIVALLIISLSACNKEPITPPTETPVVISVSPKNPKPGDVVTITGTAFGSVVADVKVAIGTNAITITSVNGTEIKFTMPTGISEGDLSVIIKNITAKNTDPQGAKISPQQTSVAIPTITSISPSSGKAGDILTIIGSNFSTVASENAIRFTVSTPTVTDAVVKSATATTLTVEVPVGVATGAISLKVNGATASAIAGTNLVFTVNGSSGGGSTGTSGQTTIFNRTISVLVNSITADVAGNVYSLSPPVRAGIPRLVRISSDGVNTKIFPSAEFGYSESDYMGVLGVSADRTGVVYVFTAKGKEFKIWKITAPDAKPTLYLTLGTNYNFSNSLPPTNFTATSTGEFFFIMERDVYKADKTGLVANYISTDGHIYDNSFNPEPLDLSIDQYDNLYVATFVSGGAFKGIYKFSPSKVKTVIYSSTVNTSNYGTLALATFKATSSIAVSPDGQEIFVGDFSSGFISKIDLNKSVVSKIAGAGLDNANAPSTGPNLDVSLYPLRIYYDFRNGAIYMLSGNNVNITRINL